jgi:hypothetical protein
MSEARGKPIYLPLGTYETLSGIKKKTGVSMSKIASLAIRDWLSKKDNQRLLEKIT